MRIVFLIKALDYSGAPKMLAWVANQMHRQGHSVKICSMYSDEIMQPLDEGIEFSYLNLSKSKSRVVRNTLDMIKSVHAVSKFMKKESPDVIVTFLDSVGYMYILKNRFSKKFKIVASERSDPYAYKGFVGKIRHKLIGMADYVVFQTEGAREFYAYNQKLQNKSTVIPNPIIPKNSLNSIPKVTYKERDNRIVSVGRLDMKQKRYDVMIEAFEKVHKKHPELELHIYGDGQDKDKVKEIINSRGLQNSVILRGRTDKVEGEIYNAKAFVMTSDYEGIPNALIEAMLSGVPCVTTDCSPGGAALLVENEKNGLLVPRGDFKAVSDAIITLVENEKLSEELSDKSPLVADRFSEQVISQCWKNCFENHINK